MAGWTLTSTSSPGRSRNRASDRMAVAGEQVAIGGAHRADQQPVLHRPAVDEQILMVGDAAVEGRQAGDAAEPRRPRAHNRCATPLSASSRSVSAATRAGRSSPGWTASVRRPSCSRREADIGPRHRQALHDVEAGGIFARAERRNLRRAGTLSNRSSTRTRVPGGSAAGPSPAELAIVDDPRQPSAPRTRLSSVSRATLAIDGSASPRKPKVATSSMRVVGQLGGGVPLERQRDLVAAPCRSRRRRPRSGRARPAPELTAIRVAPASIAFSTSSLSALAGRSTTSPAAMRLTRCSGQPPY